jgi:hypothetical protein
VWQHPEKPAQALIDRKSVCGEPEPPYLANINSLVIGQILSQFIQFLSFQITIGPSDYRTFILDCQDLNCRISNRQGRIIAERKEKVKSTRIKINLEAEPGAQMNGRLNEINLSTGNLCILIEALS